MNKPNRVGEIGYTNFGHYKMVIVEYNNNHDVTVQFQDGSTKKVTYQCFRLGEVMFDNWIIGQTTTCVNSGFARVVKRSDDKYGYLTVMFDDIPNQTGDIAQSDFIKHLVKNPWQPTVCNVGYIGKVFDKNNLCSKQTAYKHWVHIMNRCYDPKHKRYNRYGGRGVTVCKEWLCYTNFKEWFDLNYYSIPNNQMCVDKDILDKNNLEYSPNKCIIVPQDINKLFCKADKIRGKCPIGVSWSNQIHKYIVVVNNGGDNHKYIGSYSTTENSFNAYKKAKEERIRQMADKYKEYIPQKLYDALYTYEVEITD
jgi:hypothetical protein